MKSLKIEIQVEDTGDAIDFLHHVVGELHRGYSRGAGWTMEQTGQETSKNEPETDEKGSDGELVEKEEQGSGEGTQEELQYQFQNDWSDRKAGEIISASDLGDGDIFNQLIEDEVIVLVEKKETDPLEKAGGKESKPNDDSLAVTNNQESEKKSWWNK